MMADMSPYLLTYTAVTLLRSSSASARLIRWEQCRAHSRADVHPQPGRPMGPRLGPVAAPRRGVAHAPAAVLEPNSGRQRTPADVGAKPRSIAFNLLRLRQFADRTRISNVVTRALRFGQGWCSDERETRPQRSSGRSSLGRLRLAT